MSVAHLLALADFCQWETLQIYDYFSNCQNAESATKQKCDGGMCKLLNYFII